MTTTVTNTRAMTKEAETYLQLTRVYKGKEVPAGAVRFDTFTGEKLTPEKVGVIKTQPITVKANSVEYVRPCNKLGYPEHRSTIVLTNGREIHLKDRYSRVRDSLIQG